MIVESFAPTLWEQANFAEFWHRDTATEAVGAHGVHSTRREIVFACSFLESYLFEWALRVCCDRTRDGLERINEYFPPSEHRNVLDKWREVPPALAKAGYIPTVPNLDLSELGTLVAYRNGLVHGRASRPSAEGLSGRLQPVPSVGKLAEIRHGWALRVVETLVRKLHADLGTAAPSYI